MRKRKVPLLVVPAAVALAAEKEEPFKYRNLPVEASCLDGYHPTIDGDGNKVFPCIANAEIVAPGGKGPAVRVSSLPYVVASKTLASPHRMRRPLSSMLITPGVFSGSSRTQALTRGELPTMIG